MSMLLGEVVLDETTLEQRLAILEHTVADLKCRIDSIAVQIFPLALDFNICFVNPPRVVT